MREKPILFSGEMVKAILAGRKTQTRRAIKNLDMIQDVRDGVPYFEDDYGDWHKTSAACPYGQPGNQLWVKETWAYPIRGCEIQNGVSYRADHIDPSGDASPIKWRPSIFMPRWASRINLLIKNVRVERLQEISESDAIAEGIEIPSILLTGATYPNLSYEIDGPSTIVDYYHQLWDTINAKRGYPWASNPWVWVVEFYSVTKGVTHGAPTALPRALNGIAQGVASVNRYVDGRIAIAAENLSRGQS